MRYIFLILIFAISANSANLLTHNIYDRSDRVDIMLSFDSPYDGKISQKRGENSTTLTLDDLTYDKLIKKNINSNILQSIKIQPNNDSINITLKSTNPIGVIASKTVDGFGLRIRTKPLPRSKQKEFNTATSSSKKTAIETKDDQDLVDGRYLSVIFILSIMILFMIWAKKRVLKKSSDIKEKKSWLFNRDKTVASTGEITLLQKRQVDGNNSVVLLEFEERKYLVMTGNSNVLLERFSKAEIKDDSDFEKAFEDNRKKLDEYLRIQQLQDEQEQEIPDDYRSKLERY